MYIKKIKFERTGGFAGIRLAANIEINELPDDQKRELLKLIDEADIDEIPDTLAKNASAPDEFTYNIIFITDDIEHTIMVGDSSLPEDIQPLIQQLEKITKTQMRKKSD